MGGGKEEGGGAIAKQAVEFPQVLASIFKWFKRLS